jgi:hypothetical protein
MRPTVLVLGGACLVAAACGPKGNAESGAAADSTAVTDSVARPDSSAQPQRDSTAPASAGTKAPTVGRDSAFGPKFVIDSTGRVTPIEGRKKP